MTRTFSQTDRTTSTTRLDELVALMSARVEAGESIDLAGLTADCPELREQLEMLLPTLQAVVEFEHSFAHADATVALIGNAGHSTSSPQSPAPSPGLLGDFRILRELGRGGMGVVYEAEQISLGRRIALKVLPFAAMLDRQQLARFKNEARAAATLDHPNIVAIYSVGVERGVHYYAMHLVEGQSLAEVIAAQRKQHLPLTPGEGRGEGLSQSAIRNPQSEIDTAPVARLSTIPDFNNKEYFRSVATLGIQAAEALDHAHQNGILHRDIKPANLLLESNFNSPSPLRAISNTPTPSPLRGGLGRGAEDASSIKLWITDFGLARIEQDAGMTMTGDILGTLRYMSPEQALAKRVVIDHRSDIYSLGVTLYELLTLQPAFPGEDRQELLRQIAFDEPRKPRQINSHVPQDLETIVLKAIEKNPADRFSTAQQLADDLRRFLSSQPIRARPATPLQRVSKWSRRHVAVVWSAAVVLLISTVALVATNIRVAKWYRDAEHHRELAGRRLDEARRQEQSAKTVSALLEEMLGSSNPDQAKGPDYTVRQLLDDFSAGIDTQLANQPETEATLRATVAKAYRQLGLREQALSHFEMALELQRRAVGPKHPSVAKILVDYSWCLGDFGKSGDAIAALEEAVTIYRAHNAARDTMLNALWPLHNFYVAIRDYDRANTTAQEALALAGDLNAIDVPAVADLLHSMARSKAEQGDLPAAIEAAKHSVELHRRLHGPTHPQTAWGLTGLGWMLHAHGDLAESEAAQREALAIFRRHYGNEHKSVQWSLLRLADVLRETGNLTEFKALVDEAASGINEAIRLGRVESLVRSWLALRLVTKWHKDYDDPHLAVRLARSSIEPDSESGQGWDLLGAALYRAHELDEADAALQESMAQSDGGTAFEWFFLAMIQQRLGNHDQARRWQRKANDWIRNHDPNSRFYGPLAAETDELLRQSESPNGATDTLDPQTSTHATTDN